MRCIEGTLGRICIEGFGGYGFSRLCRRYWLVEGCGCLSWSGRQCACWGLELLVLVGGSALVDSFGRPPNPQGNPPSTLLVFCGLRPSLLSSSVVLEVNLVLLRVLEFSFFLPLQFSMAIIPSGEFVRSVQAVPHLLFSTYTPQFWLLCLSLGGRGILSRFRV